MSAIVKHLPYPVNLDGAIKKTFVNTIFATDDSLSNSFDISLYRDNAPVTIPDGASVKGYFIRYSDNATVVIGGKASGNVASVTLSEACYKKPGQFSIVIKVAADGINSAVFYGEGTIYVSSTDTLVDEENIIPSLEDLLAQIAVMEKATADANTATGNANAQAEAANTAAQNANAQAEAANTAAQNANAAAGKIDGMTVSAEASDTADAVISEVDGVKHIAFKLPKGDKGDKGDTGPQGPAGQNGTGSGTVTAVTVNGTKLEPDQTGNVDLGEMGGGDVQTVNSVPPDDAGNVQLTHEHVGARSADWMPTAQDVGARSANWMPTAQDVGARAADWMPTAQDVGAKTSEEILPAASYAVGANMLFSKSPDEYEYIMGRLNYTGIVPVYGSGNDTRTYILTSFTMNDTNLSIYMVSITGAANSTSFTLGDIKRIAFNLSTSVVKAQNLESIYIGDLYGVK